MAIIAVVVPFNSIRLFLIALTEESIRNIKAKTDIAIIRFSFAVITPSFAYSLFAHTTNL
jgi:hypothetical protein